MVWQLRVCMILYISTMSLIIIYISEVLLTLEGIQLTAGSIKGAANYQELNEKVITIHA